jgi:hypothetical protein
MLWSCRAMWSSFEVSRGASDATQTPGWATPTVVVVLHDGSDVVAGARSWGGPSDHLTKPTCRTKGPQKATLTSDQRCSIP